MMNPEQFARLLNVLESIASKQYTLTGAADWPILAVISGLLGGLLILAIGAMWADLRSTIKDNRGEWREELDKHKAENERDHDLIWNAMKDCKADCCPARRKE